MLSERTEHESYTQVAIDMHKQSRGKPAQTWIPVGEAAKLAIEALRRRRQNRLMTWRGSGGVFRRRDDE